MIVTPTDGNPTRIQNVQHEPTLPLAQGVARLLGLPIAPGLIALQGLPINCYRQFLQQKAPHTVGVVGQEEATDHWMVIATRTSEGLLFLSYLRFDTQKLAYVRQYLVSAFTRLPWHFTHHQTQHIYQLHTRLFGSPLEASSSRFVFPSPRYQSNGEVLVVHFLPAPKAAGLYHLVMEQGYEGKVRITP
jgi:hypothetical protein